MTLKPKTAAIVGAAIYIAGSLIGVPIIPGI